MSFLGIDFGTDSVRALIVDEAGQTLAEAVRPYPRWGEGRYIDAASGMFRQHPLDYIEAMTAAVREAVSHGDAAEVKGIGVDTTGSTPCLTDASGLPLALRPEFAEDPDAMFILWKDHTAIEEERRINEVAHSGEGPDYTAYEGGIYSCEWYWSKVLHVLRANPRVRAAAAGAIEHCDWIPAVLTGGNPVAVREQGTGNEDFTQSRRESKGAEIINHGGKNTHHPPLITYHSLCGSASSATLRDKKTPPFQLSACLRSAARRSRCASGHKAMWHASWGGLPPESFFERVDPLLVPFRRATPDESYTPTNQSVPCPGNGPRGSGFRKRWLSPAAF